MGEGQNILLTISFEGDELVQLLKQIADGLSGLGSKVNEDKKPDGEMKAVKAHLEDMRTLVFKTK